MSGRVGRVASMLGFAGLLPPLATTAAIGVGRGDPGLGTLLGPIVGLAVLYPLVILSFLGGMWWGFAMRRDAGQGRSAAIAVVPSLAAVALLGAIGVTGQVGWGLLGIGAAVLLTLPVDRHLVATGEAPAGWMALRVPLSVGLGGLTILAGALIGSPATIY